MHATQRISLILRLCQFVIAVVFGTGVFAILRVLNPLVSQLVLSVLVSLVCFGMMSFYRARWSARQNRLYQGRDYRFRPGDGGPDRGRGGWSGVREPRRPLRPNSPPQAIAINPDQDER